VPSFIRLSPPTTVPTRPDTPSLRKTASAVTGSVGARIAPRTKAAAQGRPIRKCATIAIAAVVHRTSPTARSRIGLRWARNSSGEEKKAAALKSGGRKMIKITSGAISISGNPGTNPMPRPPRTRKMG
jgi:hypothetical protein